MTDEKKLERLVLCFHDLFDTDKDLFQNEKLCHLALAAIQFSSPFPCFESKLRQQIERNRIKAIVDSLGAGEKISLDEVITKLKE